MAALYYPLTVIGDLLIFSASSSGPSPDSQQARSFFLFLVLVALQLVRAKFERTPTEQHLLGRALYLPLVLLCFTFCLLVRLSAFQVCLHLLFLAAYASFYWGDLRQALGLDRSYSLLDEAA